MATVDSLVVKRPARELAMGDWVALFQKDSGAFSGWFMIVAPWKNDDVIGIAADGSTTRIGCTADELLDVWCGIGQPSSPVAPAPLPLPRDRRLEADIAESTRAALCTPGRAAETIAALCTRVWNRARKELEVELTETRKQHAHAWTRVNAGVEVLEADLAAEKKAVADLTAALRSIEGTHDATCKSLESEILQLKTQLGLSRLKAATEAEKTPKEEVAPPKDPPYESLDPVRYHAIAAYEAERNRQGSPIAQPADAAKALLGALVNPMAAAVFRDRDKEVFFAAFILGYRKATSVWEDEKGEKTAPQDGAEGAEQQAPVGREAPHQPAALVPPDAARLGRVSGLGEVVAAVRHARVLRRGTAGGRRHARAARLAQPHLRLRARAGRRGRAVRLVLDDEEGPVHLPAVGGGVEEKEGGHGPLLR